MKLKTSIIGIVIIVVLISPSITTSARLSPPSGPEYVRSWYFQSTGYTMDRVDIILGRVIATYFYDVYQSNGNQYINLNTLGTSIQCNAYTTSLGTHWDVNKCYFSNYIYNSDNTKITAVFVAEFINWDFGDSSKSTTSKHTIHIDGYRDKIGGHMHHSTGGEFDWLLKTEFSYIRYSWYK